MKSIYVLALLTLVGGCGSWSGPATITLVTGEKLECSFVTFSDFGDVIDCGRSTGRITIPKRGIQTIYLGARSYE